MKSLTRAFFGNLLPEGAVRDVIAARLGVSPEDEFALLAAIGRDCAGALVIVPSGGEPFGRAPGVDWPCLGMPRAARSGRSLRGVRSGGVVEKY